MRWHIRSDPYTATEMARALGGDLTDADSADAVVVFDYAPEVEGIAHKAVCVAMGPYSSYVEATAQKWVSQGVAPENIVIVGADTLMAALPLIKSRGEALRPQKKRLIAFFAPKGGTGRTTFAASLADHFVGLGERAVVADLCSPANASYHISDVVPSLSHADGFDRVIADLPPNTQDLSAYEAVVLVADADVVQCLKPAERILNGIRPAAVIYNRARPETSAEVFKKAFPGVPVIEVADDFASCAAALAAGVPASRKSVEVAQAVGKLAAFL